MGAAVNFIRQKVGPPADWRVLLCCAMSSGSACIRTCGSLRHKLATSTRSVMSQPVKPLLLQGCLIYSACISSRSDGDTGHPSIVHSTDCGQQISICCSCRRFLPDSASDAALPFIKVLSPCSSAALPYGAFSCSDLYRQRRVEASSDSAGQPQKTAAVLPCHGNRQANSAAFNKSCVITDKQAALKPRDKDDNIKR